MRIIDWSSDVCSSDLLDTHYLCALKDQLEAELLTADRLAEAQEEFARLTQVQPTEHAPTPEAFWGISGARDLPAYQAAVLREVYWYREQQAQQINQPPFKVMGEQTLLEIAQRCPRRADELREITGMTPAQVRRHAASLLKAVQRGLAGPCPQHPPFVAEPDDVRERYEALRQWRKQRAQSRSVESDVIVPREALRELALRAPHTLEELIQITSLGPWRRKTYGAEILKVLAGR